MTARIRIQHHPSRSPTLFVLYDEFVYVYDDHDVRPAVYSHSALDNVWQATCVIEKFAKFSGLVDPVAAVLTQDERRRLIDAASRSARCAPRPRVYLLPSFLHVRYEGYSGIAYRSYDTDPMSVLRVHYDEVVVATPNAALKQQLELEETDPYVRPGVRRSWERDVIYIQGESGIGKSTCAQQFVFSPYSLFETDSDAHMQRGITRDTKVCATRARAHSFFFFTRVCALSPVCRRRPQERLCRPGRRLRSPL